MVIRLGLVSRRRFVSRESAVLLFFAILTIVDDQFNSISTLFCVLAPCNDFKKNLLLSSFQIDWVGF